MILAFFSISCQIFQIRNEKARRYLSSMRKKKPVPFSQKFPNADPLALRLLERMLAFEPKDRPSAEEVAILFFLFCLMSLHVSRLLFFGIGAVPKTTVKVKRKEEHDRKRNIM